MKQWNNPEIIDLKMTLTAGAYRGNSFINCAGKGQHSDATHTPPPTISIAPDPSVGPSAILD